MVSAVFRRRNPGGHPPHGPGPWVVPVPGGVTVDREASGETERHKIGIHLRGRAKRGGRIQGDRKIYSEKVEFVQAVHSYVISYGPV